MKTLKKALALIMSLAILCSIPITVSAAPVPEATIDTTKTGSLSLFKYDLTSAEKDGIWDSSYVSTGVKESLAIPAGYLPSTQTAPPTVTPCRASSSLT